MSYRGARGPADHPVGPTGRGAAGGAVGARTLTMGLLPVQMKRASGGGGAAADAQPAAAAGPSGGGGGGQPLPGAVRAKMEAAFGADFSAVRVHEDGEASAVGARAYTQGHEIHFAPGQYQPESPAGQELLGHELAHVVQQSQGRVQAATQAQGLPINEDAGLEREADEAGGRAARGEAAGIGEAGTGGGQAMQLAAGQTILQIMTALGVGAGMAATVYWLAPAYVVTALVTGGLGALSEYWYGVVASIIGVSGGTSEKKQQDPETGGLGLGFTNLRAQEDAFGKQGVDGNLSAFRTDLRLTGLAPPLTQEQTVAASKLCKFPILKLKSYDSANEVDIKQFGTTNPDLAQALREVQSTGLTNLQIGEFCDCYLRVIDALIGPDSSAPVQRDQVQGLDNKQPSSLSSSILAAMYREQVIRSNLAGFTDDQIAWARKTSPVLPQQAADEARQECKQDLRNDDCNLWNVMHKAPSFKWSSAVVPISVWEVATLIHTPELRNKTKFYNYNTTDQTPDKNPIDSEWVFTGQTK